MKYPEMKCDHTGVLGANHTEPIMIDDQTHVCYLSDEAWNHMQQLNGRIRNNDESAEPELEAFWVKVRESVYFRTMNLHD